MGDSRNRRQQNRRPKTDSRNGKQATDPEEGRRIRRIFVFVFTVSMVITGTVVEMALKRNFVQGPFIWGTYKIIAGSIFLGLGKLSYNIYKKSKDLQQPRKEEDTVCEDILRKSCLFLGSAVRDTVMVVLILILLWVSTTAAWARFQVSSRSVEGWKAFWDYEPQYETQASEADNQTEYEDERKRAVSGMETAKPEPTEPNTTETEAGDNSHQVDIWIDPAPQGIQGEVQNEQEIEEKARRMLFQEPVRDWNITEQEKQRLLFAEGEYIVSADWDVAQAEIKVKAYVNSLIEQHLPNTFDAMADPELNESVARASEMDASLATSTEKDEIITIRTHAYNIYSKATLAKLLADDFLCYSLAYNHENGDREKSLSCCFLSLQWLYERLKFEEISPETRKEIFRSIRYRYNDIMTYSEPQTEQWERAKLLTDVFDRMWKMGDDPWNEKK